MWTQSAWRLVVILSFFMAGCGKCCDATNSTTSISSVSADNTDLSCCDVEPTRARVAAASENTKSAVSADGPVKSGPQVGQEVPGPFHPVNITGEQAGKKSCLYCSMGPNPVAAVFVRGLTPEVAALLKKLDEATRKYDKANMGSFAVFCSDKEGLDGTLKDLAGKLHLDKLVFAVDNAAGPKDYAIAKDADVTVILYNEFTVRANYAFRTGELNQNGIDSIVADMSKILPSK